MGQVSVTLNHRTYRLACNDGEEARLTELARDVKARVENLAREFGQPGDDRILLMAAVLLADELMDLREAHEAMLAAAAEVLRDAAAQPGAKSDTAKSQAAAAHASKPDATKPEPGRPDLGGQEAARPDTSRSEAAKQQSRPPSPSQSGTAGGSGQTASPQTASAKGAKSSAA